MRKKKQAPAYSFYHTRMSLDEACQQFEKVKELTIRLAEIENSAYRLAYNIKKDAETRECTRTLQFRSMKTVA